MELEFIESQYGKRMLKLDGHIFVKDRAGNKEKTYWKCKEFSSKNCKKRIITQRGTVIANNGIHTHPSEVAKVIAAEATNSLKQEARISRKTPSQIVSTVVGQLDKEVIAKLPLKYSMKRTIQRVQVESKVPRPIVKSLVDLMIIQEQVLMPNGDCFLFWDSGPEEDRIIMLGTEVTLQWLDTSFWSVDGTFATAPSLFYQLFTFHAHRRNTALPCLFVLLPGKSEEVYTRMLESLKHLRPQLNPTKIISDFEKAILNSFQYIYIYPAVSQHGCFFHFTQAVFKQLQILGLQSEYENNKERRLAHEFRQLLSLAFLPENEVQIGFEELLLIELMKSSQGQKFLDYFERTWIGRPHASGTRTPALFPPSLWSCYKSVIFGEARTNNAVEGWHRGFLTSVGSISPNIWKFIDNVRDSLVLTQTRIIELSQGAPTPQKRKQARAVDARYEQLIGDYSSLDSNARALARRQFLLDIADIISL